MTTPVRCPCGKGESIDVCCGPYLRGESHPATAADLMRARYTAFATGAVDFIISSHHQSTRDQIDRKHIELWSKESKWLGLEIRSTEGGGPTDETGMVEFVATYEVRKMQVPHHERAEFQKVDGKWFFSDGKDVKAQPIRAAKTPGRNDPCDCGSGKKYKKCHGAA